MSAGTYADFINAYGQFESGNSYGFVSSPGYLGRFQFGEEALQAIGFYGGDSTSVLDFTGAWTPAAAAYGVVDKASFLAAPAAQDAALQAWFERVNDDLRALDLDRFQGQTLNGVVVTKSGLIAGASLVGVWALRDYLQSDGQKVTGDYNGTTVADYIRVFADYDTPFSGAATSPPIAGDGDGDDDLVGGPGENYLRGGAGADRLSGGAVFDDLNGNAGDDTVHGGLGGDWVLGGRDDDQLFGDGGDDLVHGNLGADSCEGGDGADTVRGGQADDRLAGGAGDDWLSGDRGADTLSGGPGADTFRTFAETGLDRVDDFNAADGDRVQLDAGVRYTVAQEGVDTVVDLGGGHRMVLAGVSMSGLPAGWIFEA